MLFANASHGIEQSNRAHILFCPIQPDVPDARCFSSTQLPIFKLSCGISSTRTEKVPGLFVFENVNVRVQALNPCLLGCWTSCAILSTCKSYCHLCSEIGVILMFLLLLRRAPVGVGGHFVDSCTHRTLYWIASAWQGGGRHERCIGECVD